MCQVVVADLGSNDVAFDPARFVIVVSDRLTADERENAVRDAFADAGQQQDEAEPPVCVCGLDIDVPPCHSASQSFIPASARRFSMAIGIMILWVVGHLIMSANGFW